MLLFAPIKIALKIVSMLISALVVYVIVTAVQVGLAANAAASSTTAAPSASAIILLVPTQTTETPTPDLLGRLQETLALYQSNVGSQIDLVDSNASTLPQVQLGSSPYVPSGGTSAANQWLTTHGIPSSLIANIYTGSTFSSFTSIAQRVGSSSRVVIVADALEALWVSHVANSAGLRNVIIYAPLGSKQSVFHEFGGLWRQTVGVAVGRIIGFNHMSLTIQ